MDDCKMILEAKTPQNNNGEINSNTVNNIKKFIEEFGSMHGSILYGTEITISSSYYAFQVNGVQINKIDIVDDCLVLKLANNRVAEFKILSETSIKFEKYPSELKYKIDESWLMD